MIKTSGSSSEHFLPFITLAPSVAAIMDDFRMDIALHKNAFKNVLALRYFAFIAYYYPY